MSLTRVLAQHNLDEEFVAETDASGYEIGAVLSQNKRPIAYLSKAIFETKRSKSIYEKEMLHIFDVISC